MASLFHFLNWDCPPRWGAPGPAIARCSTNTGWVERNLDPGRDAPAAASPALLADVRCSNLALGAVRLPWGLAALGLRVTLQDLEASSHEMLLPGVERPSGPDCIFWASPLLWELVMLSAGTVGAGPVHASCHLRIYAKSLSSSITTATTLSPRHHHLLPRLLW